jgi:hypothetical protein
MSSCLRDIQGGLREQEGTIHTATRHVHTTFPVKLVVRWFCPQSVCRVSLSVDGWQQLELLAGKNGRYTRDWANSMNVSLSECGWEGRKNATNQQAMTDYKRWPIYHRLIKGWNSQKQCASCWGCLLSNSLHNICAYDDLEIVIEQLILLRFAHPICML